jgi:hypothetical protein
MDEWRERKKERKEASRCSTYLIKIQNAKEDRRKQTRMKASISK